MSCFWHPTIQKLRILRCSGIVSARLARCLRPVGAYFLVFYCVFGTRPFKNNVFYGVLWSSPRGRCIFPRIELCFGTRPFKNTVFYCVLGVTPRGRQIFHRALRCFLHPTLQKQRILCFRGWSWNAGWHPQPRSPGNPRRAQGAPEPENARKLLFWNILHTSSGGWYWNAGWHPQPHSPRSPRRAQGAPQDENGRKLPFLSILHI